MSATATNVSDLARLGQLQSQATSVQNEIDAKQGELQSIMGAIRDIASDLANGVAPAAPTVRRTPQVRQATPNATGKRGRGRPRGSANKQPAKGAKSADRRSRSTNERPLRAVIWDVFGMKPAAIRTILPDFPANANGLKVAEVKDVIESEKLWSSETDSLGQQVQQHVHKLKNLGKLQRGDDRRYTRVAGQTLE